jgi:hypothetical protein
MSDEARTVCQIVLSENGIEIGVARPDGLRTGWPVRGDFDLPSLERRLPPLVLSDVGSVQEYGRSLFEEILGDAEVLDRFNECEMVCDDSRVQVCIEIETEPAGLSELRWEYLADRAQPNPRCLAMQSPFVLVRRLRSTDHPPVRRWEPLAQRPRLLAVISNPKDLESFQTPEGYTFTPIEHPVRREQTQALSQLMDDLKRRRLIADYQLVGAGVGPPHPQGFPTLGLLQDVLLDAIRMEKPHHIVHFLAHGYVDEEGHGCLILPDEFNKATIVSDAALIRLFPASHHVRLVILAACQPPGEAKQTFRRSLVGLAPSLLQRGVDIPGVIAMQDEISVGAAQTFTEAFYRALGAHGYVDSAVATARQSTATTYPTEWAIPVLYLQNENPRLFTPDASPGAGGVLKQLFQTTPVLRFVGREEELKEYVQLLCEQEAPSVRWLWGHCTVGKRTLQRQLRYEAYLRGYGHLTYENRHEAPVEGASNNIRLHNLLTDLIGSRGLDGDAVGRTCFAGFLQARTQEQSATFVVRKFLDGLGLLAEKVERGIVCFLYFRHFEHNREFLASPPFKELASQLTDRYTEGKLQRIRMMIAVEQPRSDADDLFGEIFRDGDRHDYVSEHELLGLQGTDSIRDLCRCYDILRDGRVPSMVCELAKRAELPDGGYLPGPIAEWLARTAQKAEDTWDFQWVELDGLGGR